MPRWFLVVFAIVLAVAIGHELVSEANRTRPNLYESIEADRLADQEAGAAILARSRAQDAFDASIQACTDAGLCQSGAKSAAMQTALAVLTDSGCIEWEMSQWDPSRGTAVRAAGKSRVDAEVECRGQAFAIADRIAQFAAAHQRKQ